MTVSEAITKSGITPSASYTGIETANDFVLAFQIESTQTKESQWIVCADHVKEHSGSLNATTEDAQYIRTGNVTEKTGTQRTLAVNGDRCVGDDFQDFVLSHKIVYGTGSDIIVPYIYFSIRTADRRRAPCLICCWTSCPPGGMDTRSSRISGPWSGWSTPMCAARQEMIPSVLRSAPSGVFTKTHTVF